MGLAEDLGSVPITHMVPSVIPLLEDLTPALDAGRHQACLWVYIHIYIQTKYSYP